VFALASMQTRLTQTKGFAYVLFAAPAFLPEKIFATIKTAKVGLNQLLFT
jgi:hypothetical protein